MAKECYFSQSPHRVIDYRDTELLRKFLNPSGKILPGRRSGVCAKHQRELARAVKRARFMALLPYIIR